jgi:hypothetical protein
MNNIQEHHNEEEVQYLSMESDVALWRSKLEFVADEMEFYLILLGSSLIERTQSNTIDANFLLKQFNELKEANKFHLKTCIHFQNKLRGKDECDDIQCENAYLQSHLMFKGKLEKHFLEIRNIKKSAFTYLKNGIVSYIK